MAYALARHPNHPDPRIGFRWTSVPARTGALVCLSHGGANNCGYPSHPVNRALDPWWTGKPCRKLAHIHVDLSGRPGPDAQVFPDKKKVVLAIP